MPAPAVATSQLGQIAAELDQCSAQMRALVWNMSDAALWKRPAAGGWSIAECIDHLTVSSRQFIPGIESGLAEAAQEDAPYKLDFRGRLLAWILEPPYRIRTKAVPNMQPGGERPKDQLVTDFLAAQTDVQALIARSTGKAIDRVIIASPVNARMKYNIFSAFKIIAAHQRRHLWQASRIKQHI